MFNAPEEVIREVLALEQAKKNLGIRAKAQEDFMTFVKHVYEGFIEGDHHKKLHKNLKSWPRTLVHGSLSTCHRDIRSLSSPVTCFLRG